MIDDSESYLQALPVGATPRFQGDWVPEYMSQKENHILIRRWVATWIDFIICAALSLFCMGLLKANSREMSGAVIMLIFLVPPMYFFLTEALTGYTLGKLISRTKVVDRYGKTPKFSKIFLRTVLRFVEVNPFFLGGIPAGIVALFSEKNQRLGDMAADTYVIPCRVLSRSVL